MDLTRWRRKAIRLALFFTLIFSSGLMAACSGGGGTEKPQVDAGAPAETDPANEKTWDKMVWDTGTWERGDVGIGMESSEAAIPAKF